MFSIQYSVFSNAVNDALTEYQTLRARVRAALREDLREEEFGVLALEVSAFQRRWNEPYARFCAMRPESRTWQEIPAVPQSAFKRSRLSIAPHAVTKTFRTSGTTGEGYGEHHFIDMQLYDAAILSGWNRLLLPEAVPVLLTPKPDAAPHSSLAHMMGVLARERGRDQAIWLIDANGTLNLERFIAAMRVAHVANRPVALLGTALAFLNLFEQLSARRFVLPPGSYALETGGYKGSGRDIPKTELYAKFSQYLGLAADEVINEYGMTELSSQFYTRGLGQPHTAGPWLRALVIDPETGAEVAVGSAGVLRIFDLANLGSVLAIETRDLAIRREKGFELLGRDPAALPRGCSRAADEMLNA